MIVEVRDVTCCDYCGLPVSAESGASAARVYCCFGCRFASQIAGQRDDQGQNRWLLWRLGLAIFFTMNVSVFTMTLWTQDVYQDAAGEPLAAHFYSLLRYLGLVFSAPVLLLLGGPLVEESLRGLRQQRVTTELLLVSGVLASFAYSLVSVFRETGHVYFEIGCVVLVTVTLGRWLEATGKLKTTEALRGLSRLLPREARVVDSLLGEAPTPLDQVALGQLVRVLPSERIPLDGRIVKNRASIDEQVVTGESSPVVKEAGEVVYGGTLNLDGDLIVSVTATADAGSLQRLIDAVTAAALARGSHQRLADRLTRWFVPVVVVIACLTVAVHASWGPWHDALLAGLAVVVIACPCALGVATPMAIWAALGRAAQAQILFRDGDALSRLAVVRAVAFDKTGTLTTGKALVDAAWTDEAVERRLVWQRARALAASSPHELSRAILQYCAGEDGLEQPRRLRVHAGRGIAGECGVENATVHLGSPRYMQECGLVAAAPLAAAMDDVQQHGRSLACVGWSGRVQGVFRFQEEFRPEAHAALAALRDLGLHVTVLTGDHRARASVVAAGLGVPVEAELLPEDKHARVAALRRDWGCVAMVGDGVNDAPALAAADVGIAMGCGADVSREAADVCLLGDSLDRLPRLIPFARRAVRVIRGNLFWAFAYNVAGIGFAACGWLNPILASVAMLASSLFVISNSLRLSQEPL